MSYDYFLFRARHPIRGFEDVDAPNLAPIGSYVEIKRLFGDACPGMEWDDERRHGLLKDETAHFEVSCFRDEPVHICVKVGVWFPDRIRERLAEISRKAGLFAFDPQRGEVVGGQLEPPSP